MTHYPDLAQKSRRARLHMLHCPHAVLSQLRGRSADRLFPLELATLTPIAGYLAVGWRSNPRPLLAAPTPKPAAQIALPLVHTLSGPTRNSIRGIRRRAQIRCVRRAVAAPVSELPRCLIMTPLRAFDQAPGACFAKRGHL